MTTNKHRYRIIALALAGIAGLAFVAYYVNQGASGPVAPAASQKPAAGAPAGTPAAVAVEVATARPESFADEATAVGTLKSNESVVLRPEISGRIARIGFKDGEVVARGTLLLALDGAIQQAELQQAQANLALARSTQKRNQDLFEKKFISQQALDNSAAALQIQQATVALAQAKVAKTRIQAPFAGVVGIRDVSLGDYVKEGQDLVNLEDISTLKVDFRMPEAYLGRLQKGLMVEVTSDALAGEPYKAVLDAVDPLVDASGRSISCRALLPNPLGQLRPGMFVRVRVQFGEKADALMIPEQAVVPGGKPMVFLVADGKAKATPVRLGVRRAGRVEVLEGLRPGDLVITAGQLKVKDGLAVRPVGEGAPQADGMAGMSGMAGMMPVNGK